MFYCIADVASWGGSRQLQLNAAKTELMWFGSSSTLCSMTPSNRSVVVGTDVLQSVESVRSLCVYFDSKLWPRWGRHAFSAETLSSDLAFAWSWRHCQRSCSLNWTTATLYSPVCTIQPSHRCSGSSSLVQGWCMVFGRGTTSLTPLSSCTGYRSALRCFSSCPPGIEWSFTELRRPAAAVRHHKTASSAVSSQHLARSTDIIEVRWAGVQRCWSRRSELSSDRYTDNQ